VYIYIKGSQKKGVECNGVIAVSFEAPLPRNYLELSELSGTIWNFLDFFKLFYLGREVTTP
jgi:hypothetical protein